MLMWHRQLKLIDHGAALDFHHSWNQYLERAGDPFTRVKDHILLPFAAALEESDAPLSALPAPEVLENIVALIPESWLGTTLSGTPLRRRPQGESGRRYIHEYLQLRLKQRHAFVQEALRAARPQERSSYDYAIVRVVPRVEREEFVNVGVIVSCPQKGFPGKPRIEVDESRLKALDPGIDIEATRAHLASIPAICTRWERGRHDRQAVTARAV